MPIFNIGSGEAFRIPALNGNFPADVSVSFVAGESKSAAFKVEVTDAGMPSGHTFQWYVNGEAVIGATAATYTRSGISTAGTYTVYCRVTNAAGTVQSRTAMLTAVQYKLPVLDASLPADGSVSVVENATGSMTFKTGITQAGNPDVYTYQWYVNGSAVSGANAASYTRTGLTAGTYKVYCVVSNAAGSVASRTATLTVTQYTRPVLNASYPANATVMESANGSAAFKVSIATAGVPASYTYQWYVNNSAVSGATASSYTKTGLTAAGTYTVYCRVTNAAGTVQSRTATLTVTSSQPTYTYTGSHQLIRDGSYNWRIKFLSSGTLKFTHLGNGSGSCQVFLVGGGGGGGYLGDYNTASTGGGGGCTTTAAVTLATETNYAIVVGAGGAGSYTYDKDEFPTGRVGATGGQSSAFGKTANGGTGGGPWMNGGTGGSGGGGVGGTGGENGGNGGVGKNASDGGTGQGTTTREFAETDGTLYAGGGGGGGTAWYYGGAGGDGGGGKGAAWSKNAEPTPGGTNTGGGGGGASDLSVGDQASNGGTQGSAVDRSSAGGSGIVVLRNKR